MSTARQCEQCRQRDTAYQRRYDLLVDEIIRLQRIVQKYEPGEFWKDNGSGEEYRESTKGRRPEATQAT